MIIRHLVDFFQPVFGVQSYGGMGSQFGWNKSGYTHCHQPMAAAPNYGPGHDSAQYGGAQSRFMQPGMVGGSGPVQCQPNYSLGYNSQFGHAQAYQVSRGSIPEFQFLS